MINERLLPRPLWLIAVMALMPFSSAFAQAEPVPDTLDWRRYFPLEIGNEWHYRGGGEEDEISYSTLTVVGDTVLSERTYFVLQRCHENEGDTVICGEYSFSDFVRYDEEHARLLQYVVVEGEPRDEWWSIVPCRLDADFDGYAACASGEAEYMTDGGYGYRYALPPDTLHNVAYKEFHSLPIVQGLVADVGLAWYERTHIAGGAELVYARVGGREYGAAVPTTIGEDVPFPLHADTEITVYPNPARDRAVVRVAASTVGLVSLAVYDVLGRTVRRVDEGVHGGGPQQFPLNLSELPDGMYFVRAELADGTALARPFTIIK